MSKRGSKPGGAIAQRTRKAIPPDAHLPFRSDCGQPRLLDRQERLMRWAELVGREPEQIMTLLPPSWALQPEERDELDIVGTPLEVAYRDPIFRLDGLIGPSLFEVARYFELSDREFDRILSGSWKFPYRIAWQVAARIQNVADPRRESLLFAASFALSLLLGAILAIIL